MWANNYGKGNACDGRSEALVGTLQGVAEEGNERHVMAQLTSSFPGLASLAPHLATTPACTLLGYSAHVCTHKATVQYVCAHRHMHTQYTRTHPPTQARMHGHMHTHTCTTHMHTTRMHTTRMHTTRMHTHMHNTHAHYTHAHTHAQHTCTLHACTLHACIHTRMHTHTLLVTLDMLSLS